MKGSGSQLCKPRFPGTLLGIFLQPIISKELSALSYLEHPHLMPTNLIFYHPYSPEVWGSGRWYSWALSWVFIALSAREFDNGVSIPLCLVKKGKEY